MFVAALPAFLASRLAVGAGEGLMMSATVLWLLRLAGRANRGRALGHVGLANYAGLTAGPLLADVVGGSVHPTRVFACSAVLPLVPLAIVPFIRQGQGSERRNEDAHDSFRALLPLILKPGIGLLLMNVGYAALLSFGAAAVGGASVLVLPLYALTVILVRTVAGGVPDRLGGRRTLTVAAPTAAAGLLIAALAPATVVALGGVVVLGIGQGLAVPALGLLALARVPSAQHGAASGLFFAWFDAGVAAGGLIAGAAAGLGGATAALAAASAAVLLATAVALRD
jgi:MFS family permease